MKLHFPEDGLVFDYRLDDAGISSTEDEEDEEEEGKQVTMGLPRTEGGQSPTPSMNNGHLEKATLTATRSEAVGCFCHHPELYSLPAVYCCVHCIGMGIETVTIS